MAAEVNRHMAPRPFPLCMGAAMTTWLSCTPGLSLLKPGSLPWKQLLEKLGDHPSAKKLDEATIEKLRPELSAEITQRLNDFLKGIQLYRFHPYRRNLTEPAVVWQDGSSRLLDYNPHSRGPAVFIIPPLINRPYILDLSADKSLIRWLAKQDLRPFLLDWGTPTPEERNFGSSEYMTKRIAPALNAVTAICDKRTHVLGYCMGGLFATAAAQLLSDKIKSLSLLATPWDFHAGSGLPPASISILPYMEETLKVIGELPVDCIQTFFTMIDPLASAKKYMKFAQMDQSSAEANHFVALEDWVNDGIPLGAGITRESFYEWNLKNATAKGEWKVSGEAIKPSTIKMEKLVVIPMLDKIVPPASSKALAAAMPKATVLETDLGHVGIITSNNAVKKVWQPLANFLWTQENSYSTN